MDELKPIIELFTVDILLIGAITLMAMTLAVKLGGALANAAPASGDPGVKDVLKEAWASWSTGIGKLGRVEIAFLVLAAAMVGMVVNLAADEILEEKVLVFWLSAHSVNSSEDLIKLDRVQQLTYLCLPPTLEKKIRRAVEDKKKASAFVQQAYAGVFYDEKASRFALIRTELLFVKLLRVLWLDTLLVFGACILGALCGAFVRARRRERTGKRLLVAAVLFALAWAMSGVLLRAWKEQSGRYYLKLAHAYVQIQLADDKLHEYECPSSNQNQ